MAFSDFDIFSASGASQSTVLHSAPPLATNQLSSGGSFCRQFTGINTASATNKLYYKSSSYGGAFFNIPNTKVISARAVLRVEGATAIFIIAKDPSALNNTSQAQLGGYRFGLESGNGLFSLYGSNGTALINSANTFNSPSNTWHSLRMDIFPLGTLADRIICYRESSPGSGIWSNVVGGTTFDITVSNSDGRFAPWLNNGKCGIVTTQLSTQKAWADNLQFYVQNAP
jgi:hypothetical protein